MKKITALSITILTLCTWAGASVAQDLSTPKSAAMVFAKALETGDAAGAKSAAVTDEKSAAFIDAMADLIKGSKKLKEASIAKFGDEGKDLAGTDDMDISKEINDADVKEEGDTATIVTKKDPSKPLTLKKAGGNWKVDISSVMAGEDIEKAMPTFKAMGTAMNEMAGEINEGKHVNAEAAKQALAMKMMAAFAGAGGMGGAGATDGGMHADAPTTAPTTMPSDK